jgi:hypothetical protein
LISIACGGRNAIVRGRVAPLSNSGVACIAASAGAAAPANNPNTNTQSTTRRSIA